LLPEDVPDPTEQFDKIKNGASDLFESRCLRKDGTQVNTEWSATWSSDEHLYFCSVHDTSESKQAERLRHQLIQMVSDELQKPLASITALLKTLLAGTFGKLTDKGMALRSKADSAAAQMLTLVKDLLDLENVESGSIELLRRKQSLRPLIDQSIHTVSGVAASFEVTVNSDAEDLEIYADGDRIVQVLVNLLTNAIKFSPRGGEVQIAASQTHDWTEIKVIDRGRGIPENLLSAVFDRFRQTQVSDAKQKGGSGLGLAICKALVELHGGQIRVESIVDRGSTFTVTIPNDANFKVGDHK
jgi:signal transduction histidine kinase